MKIEKLNYEKRKIHKILLYGLISVVVLLLAVTFLSSRANYKISSSVQLAKGKINYKAPDLNVIAMYQEDANGTVIFNGKKYKELSKDTLMPSANEYEINEKNSYCYKETKEVHDNNVKLYTSVYDLHVVEGLSRNDKCYLYFDKIKASTESRTMEDLIADYYVHKKYRLSSRKDFNVPFGETTRKTLYVAEDDYGTSYYFAGAPLDNWVKFGKENGKDIWWRIIRINGNGSIRMIYTGTTAPTSVQTSVMTGEQTQIGTNTFNNKHDNNMYVGFYYTSNQVHGYGTPSNIYSNNEGDANGTSLKGFYEKNIKGQSYEKWIDKDVGFCNDRTPSNSETEINNIGGTGTTATYYAVYIRLIPNGASPTPSSVPVIPSLKCSYQGTTDNSYKDSDLFTAIGATDIGSTHSNKLLDYPVGLITADEVSYAGMVFGSSNTVTTNYLYTNEVYWTISPYSYISYLARAFTVNLDGRLGFPYVTGVVGIRPVINLRSDVKFIGNGTSTNPYEVISS